MTYLNVYHNTTCISYCGGMAVAIANSPEEAHKLLLKYDKHLGERYKIEGWVCIVCAFGVGEPRFIAENSYSA